MKHVSHISQLRPAKAIVAGHPGLVDSLVGFLTNPFAIVQAHVEWLFKSV